MAKRRGSISSNNVVSSPRKTKKRLAIKSAMLATKKAKKKN
ncbi:MAG: hypothetical protein Q8P90_02650 [bacterium]|nr:hypothetical protein [bacterium]